MPQIRVLASGDSIGAKNQKRGALFEKLMRDVLRSFGYKIDHVSNTVYAGMEIDIEGTHEITGHPLYCECKCYDEQLSAPKLQAFFGKYISLWMKNPKAHGLFIAIPGLNPHAKGFYNETCKGNAQISVNVRSETEVVESLVSAGVLSAENVFRTAIPEHIGAAGESVILALDTGIVVAQRIVPKGSVFPSHYALFDSRGTPLTESASIEKILELEPELRSFERVSIGPRAPLLDVKPQERADETVVEVKGGSECFEYQFPAAPQYFVGRSEVFKEIDAFSSQVLSKTISTRGFLLEANSGWGKSSSVLACAKWLSDRNHYSAVIDSRSASSAQFILRAVDYFIAKSADLGLHFSKELKGKQMLGFDDAADRLIELGKSLESKGQLAMLFFDQFENIFFLPDSFRRIRDLFLKVSSATTNVAFGFCWKTDLVGLTDDFPYQLRDSIRASSRLTPLAKFSDTETNELLDRLSIEIRWKVRKDLHFFLSEYSQGYPWLLKKLCAHVKKQRESGVSQADIANGLLNVDQLFRDDLQGLSVEEESSLRRVAKLSPVAATDIGDDLNPAILQSLINRRLIVRIGIKLDIYWDIFRDYLNTGKIPAQEQYLPRLGTRSVYRACKSLAEHAGPVRLDSLASVLKLSSQTTYNVIHELRMLGLAKFENETVQLGLPFSDIKDLPRKFSLQVAEKLKKNRLAHAVVDALALKEPVHLKDAAAILRERCPYISASQATWEIYADVFCQWLEAGGMVRYQKKRLSNPVSSQESTEITFSTTRKRGGVQALQVHYSPVRQVVLALVSWFRTKAMVWPTMKPSTKEKCVAVLEDFEFVVRTDGHLRLSGNFAEFLTESDPDKVITKAVQKLHSFSTFLQILEEKKNVKCKVLTLGIELRKRLDVDWTDGTALTTAKISLDWARHLNLAPGVFVRAPRMPRKTNSAQPDLFPEDVNEVSKGG